VEIPNNKQNKGLPEAVGAPLWRIDEWFKDLPQALRSQLKAYHEEILNLNRSISLIGSKTVQLADALHFADCLLANQAIAKQGPFPEVYDFGSGNGFPGIIYAMQYPGTKVHLVEVDTRKAEALGSLVQKLNLKNLTIHAQTVESLKEGSVQVALSRGFAPISKSILVTRRVVKKGGRYYHLKGEEWATEIAQIPTQLCSHWRPSLVDHYKLPIGEIRFAVVVTEKISD